MKRFLTNRRRPPRAPGISPYGIALACLALPLAARAQETPAPANPAPQQPTTPPAPGAPQSANPQAPPSVDAPRPNTPPPIPQIEFSGEEENVLGQNGDVFSRKAIRVTYPGVTITSDRVEGNIYREIVFTGNAKIVAAGLTSYADAIHFFPRQRSYRLDNPRGVLEPSFLQNRLLDPVFVNGGTMRGNRDGYSLAELFHATTCVQPDPHYELRVRSAELLPHQRLTLHRVAVFFFGQKLIVLPQIVIPLDRNPRRPRTDYLPEFGRNIQEGYFARFPYTFAIGGAAAAFLRLDLTERRGVGYRVEQEYLAGKQDRYFDTSAGSNFNGGFNFTGQSSSYINAYGYGSVGGGLPRLGTGLGPTNGGLFAMSGYLADGFDRNFSASFRHQQGLGSNNRIALSTELQQNSFYSFSSQSSQTTRLGFTHADPTHGVNADTSLSYTTNSSSGFRTNQINGTYRQSFEFASVGSNRNSLSFNFDLSRYLTNSLNTFTRTARLNSEVEFQHVSRDYSFSLQGNKSSPIGLQTDNSAFGTLERLPELQFSADTINFKGGWLHQVPAHLDVGYGLYSEPGTNVSTSRILLGMTLQEQSIARGNTEVSTGGGFEQRLYGDGAAQYILRNTTRLRQRLGGRSGFDLNYQYQEPAGGTPFLFDTFGRSHYLTAEGGYLNDPKFQMTARVGYDFLGTSSERPWQSLSTRLMWRPNRHTRFDALATYDPNTSKFFSFTNSLRLRGRNDFAFDILSRYDPSVGRFSQVNGQFDIPVGRNWRVAGLLRYNGIQGRFESTNLQITRRWDCMEASLTYTETPYGFQSNRQIYFAIRLTAFPFFRSFGRGPAGEALGTGLGDLY